MSTLSELRQGQREPSPHVDDHALHAAATAPNWVANATALWERRRILARTAGVSLLLALAIAFLWPKQYESTARIMPPSSPFGGAALMAALTGRSSSGLGSLGALAGGLLGGGGNPALFINLLRSGTVSGHLIDRYDLQHVYRERYRVDTAKYLARRTAIVDDKKSGVITLTVTDTDPVRARDIAQGYLNELNKLVNSTNTSSAHQERVFVETRLTKARADLEKAQERLGEFSSTHATIDIKEQTRAMVDAAARLQSQLIVEQSGLDSLRQIYGDGNVRVRAAQARIGDLQREIAKMSGSSKALSVDERATGIGGDDSSSNHSEEMYPPLRQLPRLAVPYADLYREVRVQETLYELLTQQLEMARIQEAKDIPVVSVIDAPGIPEKKSFPPRLLLALVLTTASVTATAVLILAQMRWRLVPRDDPFRMLAEQIGSSLNNTGRELLRWPRRPRSAT